MDIKVITTNEQQNHYLQEVDSVPFMHQTDAAMEVINIYPEIAYQTISGFGGAFTEAMAYNVLGLPETKQDALIADYFGE